MTPEQEVAVDNWLRAQAVDGVEVRLANSFNEGTVRFDEYTVGEGYLHLHTDLADRARLNKVLCDDATGQALEKAGVIRFTDDEQVANEQQLG